MVVSFSSMRRARMVAIGAAAVVLGGFAFAAPTSARMMAPPPVDGTGSVSCSVTGMLAFSPPLVANGTAATETVTLKAHLTQCSGTGDGANVKSGNAVVSGTTTSDDCLTVLTTPPSGPRSGPLKWMVNPHTQRLNPSTIGFDSLSESNGPPISVDSGGSATAGSFNGDTAAAHAVLKETVLKVEKLCVGMHGLKALHFAPGSAFSLSVSTPPSA